MGKTQKIPYVREALIYFVRVFLIFEIMHYTLAYFGYLNQSLLLIFAIFAGLSFQPFYLAALVAHYAIFYFILKFIQNEFIFLFASLLATLFNTLIMILYLKLRFRLKEEE